MRNIDARQNRLLAALPGEGLAAVSDAAEVVDLPLGLNLEVAGLPIPAVYFPLSGIASVVLLRGGHRVEVGLIGREGATGLAVALGGTKTSLETVVQAVGQALAVPAAHMRDLLERDRLLRAQMHLFVLEFHLQLADTALANARGRIEERLARWLLMMQDRTGETTLNLTHDFLSQMLGVRRPGVTTALHALEERRLIRSQRGRVVLLDRPGLEERAANFYPGAPPAHLA